MRSIRYLTLATATWFYVPTVLVCAAEPRSAPSPFRFADVTGKSLGLWEGDRPVLVYNHGVMSKAGVPAKRNRSTYVHPLYGLDGEILTDDFPKDHYHQRGLFWAWPHVKTGGQDYSLWELKGVEQKFVRWLARDTIAPIAVLGVENGWYVGDKKVMTERVWLRVHPAAKDSRAIDVQMDLTPTEDAVSLAGAEGKGYGGLALRFAPCTSMVITTPLGNSPNDLPMTRLPWADLSAKFAGASQSSGAAIFIAPDHPGYPPMWLTRHYGILCVGWPGVEPKLVKPGETVRCRYRVWIHRGAPDAAELRRVYESYSNAEKTGDPSGPNASSALQLRAEAKADRVSVFIEDKLFTEYLFTPGEKYPYFYPVNGPRTGQTITTRRDKEYPHHSSLFFGCDRVNGGNYWQEGLDRGRIASKSVRLLRAQGKEIEWEQDCVWERPGAEPPFADHRRIKLSAPAPDIRHIDFEITLTAPTRVRIEKNNHSLFSVRVAPDLSVNGGGTLMNANGDRAEKGTFGQRAPWADYRGPRGGDTEGVAILVHPRNRWSPAPWFTRDYGFMSPTPIQWLDNGFVEFAKDESFTLRYRVIVHADNPSRAQLETWYQEWAKP